MTAYSYEISLANDILDCTDLIQEHRDTVYKCERGAFAPDREAFNQLQDAGMLASFTVKSDDIIIGYCMVQVFNSLHQADSVRGIVDNIYVTHAHRGQCGRKLIAFVSEQLLSFGVTDLYHLVPVSLNWGAVLKRQGFTHIEDVYHKGL